LLQKLYSDINRKKPKKPYDTPLRINPAITTPKNIDGSAYFSLISKRSAIREAVQAPVPGSGIATNNMSPTEANFKTFFVLLCPTFSMNIAILDRNLFFFISFNIFLTNNKMNGTGKKLPNTQIIKHGNHCNPNVNPIGIAPLNSITGTIEMKNTYK
jgi:hypothetical protein